MDTNDIIIMGAGCVGQALAASLLCSAINNRIFLIPSERSYLAIKQKGIQLEGALNKTFHEDNHLIILPYIDMKMVKKYSIKTGPIIFIATKSGDAVKSLCSVQDIIESFDPTIICLQNGFGAENAINSAVKSFNVTVLKGHVFSAMYRKNDKVFSYTGSIVIEEREPSISLFRTIFGNNAEGFLTLILSKDILKQIYPKFAVNCICNPLSVIFNGNLGKIKEHCLPIIEVMCDELYQLALSLDIYFQSSHILLERALKSMSNFSDHYSSMYSDIYNGKNTEIEEINGAALDLAKSKGLEMPLNEHLVSYVKKIELLRKGCQTNELYLNKHSDFLKKIKDDLILIAFTIRQKQLSGDTA